MALFLPRAFNPPDGLWANAARIDRDGAARIGDQTGLTVAREHRRMCAGRVRQDL